MTLADRAARPRLRPLVPVALVVALAAAIAWGARNASATARLAESLRQEQQDHAATRGALDELRRGQTPHELERRSMEIAEWLRVGGTYGERPDRETVVRLSRESAQRLQAEWQIPFVSGFAVEAGSPVPVRFPVLDGDGVLLRYRIGWGWAFVVEDRPRTEDGVLGCTVLRSLHLLIRCPVDDARGENLHRIDAVWLIDLLETDTLVRLSDPDTLTGLLGEGLSITWDGKRWHYQR